MIVLTEILGIINHAFEYIFIGKSLYVYILVCVYKTEFPKKEKTLNGRSLFKIFKQQF